MKRIFIGLIVVVFLVLVVGVFATAAKNTDEVPDVGSAVSKYVESFVEKRGIGAEDIKNIKEVDFEALPKEVNIENVGDHNLAIYEIDYLEETGEEQVYVITYSVNELKEQGDLIIAHDKRQFLNFGFDGSSDESRFLNTATGVEGSLEKGYVMMREGSITGISTNLDIIGSGPGQIEITIYKNGEAIGFGNLISTDVSGIKSDYDVQSSDTVTFESGDIISAYISVDGEVVWEDVITMVEITTID
jgi:hypothetical protein